VKLLTGVNTDETNKPFVWADCALQVDESEARIVTTANPCSLIFLLRGSLNITTFLFVRLRFPNYGNFLWSHHFRYISIVGFDKG
jgi:hypothetical protein